MTQLTFLEWFEKEHPKHEPVNMVAMQNKKATASSITTKEQQPPEMLIRLHHEHWETKATRALTLEILCKNDALKQYASPTRLVNIANESDVVHLANTNLIKPVWRAIIAVYPGKLVTYSEQQLDVLRPDRVFKLSSSQGKNEAVMLIEFKRCGYIHYDEFEDAMCDADEIDDKRRKLEEDDEETTLENNSNALLFVKQATAYYMSSRCRYVALCDYDKLVLLRYRHGEDLSSVDATTVPRKVFRKALLGFLLEACAAAGLS
jgi:hypothetical protein